MEKEIQKSNIENPDVLEKLEWEIPKLISLSKTKTESGPAADNESYTGDIS